MLDHEVHAIGRMAAARGSMGRALELLDALKDTASRIVCKATGGDRCPLSSSSSGRSYPPSAERPGCGESLARADDDDGCGGGVVVLCDALVYWLGCIEGAARFAHPGLLSEVCRMLLLDDAVVAFKRCGLLDRAMALTARMIASPARSRKARQGGISTGEGDARVAGPDEERRRRKGEGEGEDEGGTRHRAANINRDTAGSGDGEREEEEDQRLWSEALELLCRLSERHSCGPSATCCGLIGCLCKWASRVAAPWEGTDAWFDAEHYRKVWGSDPATYGGCGDECDCRAGWGLEKGYPIDGDDEPKGSPPRAPIRDDGESGRAAVDRGDRDGSEDTREGGDELERGTAARPEEEGKSGRRSAASACKTPSGQAEARSNDRPKDDGHESDGEGSRGTGEGGKVERDDSPVVRESAGKPSERKEARCPETEDPTGDDWGDGAESDGEGDGSGGGGDWDLEEREAAGRILDWMVERFGEEGIIESIVSFRCRDYALAWLERSARSLAGTSPAPRHPVDEDTARSGQTGGPLPAGGGDITTQGSFETPDAATGRATAIPFDPVAAMERLAAMDENNSAELTEGVIRLCEGQPISWWRSSVIDAVVASNEMGDHTGGDPNVAGCLLKRMKPGLFSERVLSAQRCHRRGCALCWSARDRDADDGDEAFGAVGTAAGTRPSTYGFGNPGGEVVGEFVPYSRTLSDSDDDEYRWIDSP